MVQQTCHILCITITHTHKSDFYTFTSPECKSTHFLLEWGEAVLDLRCVLLGRVIGILLLSTVQSCMKVYVNLQMLRKLEIVRDG